jgi:hypothetical protein
MLFDLYGCETWSLTHIREQHKLRMLENKVRKRIFGNYGELRNYITRSFIICAPHQALPGQSNQGGRNEREYGMCAGDEK